MLEERGREIGASVFARLEPRRLEVEEAIFTRVRTLSGSVGPESEEYEATLRAAVSAGVGHGLAGIERGSDAIGTIPAALFAEARQAARCGIALDLELRRYFAGYALFCDFVIETVADGPSLQGSDVRYVLQSLAVIFDRLVPAVVGEYTHEQGGGPQSSVVLVDRAQRLLAGEPVASGDLSYELDNWHVGAIGCGDGAEAALRAAASAVDRHLLLVRPGRGTVWAWLGGRNRVAVAEIADRLRLELDAGSGVALGEPARGIEGWRLTHRQADAAFAIARRRPGSVVQYADVSLIASISKDRLVASSLQQLYLAPLADARDGGATLRRTLRAYFAAGRNVSSAASALGVSRQTVGARLRAIEEKLGRTIESCAPEIEIALRLEEMSRSHSVSPAGGTRPY